MNNQENDSKNHNPTQWQTQEEMDVETKRNVLLYFLKGVAINLIMFNITGMFRDVTTEHPPLASAMHESH